MLPAEVSDRISEQSNIYFKITIDLLMENQKSFKNTLAKLNMNFKLQRKLKCIL